MDNLKSALLRLQQKMAEAESKSDMMIAQHRRVAPLARRRKPERDRRQLNAAAFDRMKSKVQPARSDRTGPGGPRRDVNAKFAAMEKQEEIDRLLQEIKARRAG